jgi:hypothetical protein
MHMEVFVVGTDGLASERISQLANCLLHVMFRRIARLQGIEPREVKSGARIVDAVIVGGGAGQGSKE